jgi:hypothetical protein
MRNLLESSSVAQSLDDEPSDGEPAYPHDGSLIPDMPGHKRHPPFLHLVWKPSPNAKRDSPKHTRGELDHFDADKLKAYPPGKREAPGTG